MIFPNNDTTSSRSRVESLCKRRVQVVGVETFRGYPDDFKRILNHLKFRQSPSLQLTSCRKAVKYKRCVMTKKVFFSNIAVLQEVTRNTFKELFSISRQNTFTCGNRCFCLVKTCLGQRKR